MINSRSDRATSFFPRVLRTVGIALLAGIAGCGAPPEHSQQGLGSTSSNLTASKFKGWTSLGYNILSPLPQTFTSGPAVDARGPITLDLFARGSDNAVYYNYGYTSDNWATGHWSGWSSIGGVVLGRPSASSWGASQYLVVAARGTDNKAYVDLVVPAETDSGLAWTGWSPVSNGVLSNEPAVANVNGEIFVFGNGTDNKVYWSRTDVSRGYNPNGWLNWAGPIPGGVLSSEPAVGVGANNTLYVVGRATNNLYYITKSLDFGTTWSAWTVVDAAHTYTTGPALSVSPSGQLNVFGVLSGGTMNGLTSNDGGSSWGGAANAAGNLTASPGVVASANGIIQTFGLNASDSLIYWDPYKE